MDKIKEHRELIDIIDNKILELLNKRFDHTNMIGLLKKELEVNILDTKREEEIYKKTSKYSHYPELRHIYKTIMEQSKKAQGK